jgi:hypothetical protein
MKLNPIILPILVMIAIAGCAKDPEQTPLSRIRRDLQPKGSISGTTRDRQNLALPSICVVADGEGYAALSNGRGDFIVENLPAGTYSLRFMRYGFLDTVLHDISLEMNEDVRIGDVFMQPSLALVSGTVFSAAHPGGVANAAVALPGHPFTTFTDNSGKFELQGVPPRSRRIIASAGDDGWGQGSLDLSAGERTTVTLRLDREGGTVSGSVLAADGSLEQNAIVSALGGLLSDTAHDGTFLLVNVPVSTPLELHAGKDRSVCGVLVPRDIPLTGIVLGPLQRYERFGLAIVDRVVYALEPDSVQVTTCVYKAGTSLDAFDSVSVFLWDLDARSSPVDSENPYETVTSQPDIRIAPEGQDYPVRYGIITLNGDTLAGAAVTFQHHSFTPDIRFDSLAYTPAHRSSTGGDSVVLRWNAADAGGRPLEYDIYFGDTDTYPPPLWRQAVVDTFLAVAPRYGWTRTGYHWQIQARCGTTRVSGNVLTFTHQ